MFNRRRNRRNFRRPRNHVPIQINDLPDLIKDHYFTKNISGNVLEHSKYETNGQATCVVIRKNGENYESDTWMWDKNPDHEQKGDFRPFIWLLKATEVIDYEIEESKEVEAVGNK